MGATKQIYYIIRSGRKTEISRARGKGKKRKGGFFLESEGQMGAHTL
jgi:hypothetical protein